MLRAVQSMQYSSEIVIINAQNLIYTIPNEFWKEIKCTLFSVRNLSAFQEPMQLSISGHVSWS